VADVAGWDDLVSYVRVRYEVMRQADDELWFNLPTTGDRTQLVVVRRVTGADGEPWAQIASPICKVAAPVLIINCRLKTTSTRRELASCKLNLLRNPRNWQRRAML